MGTLDAPINGEALKILVLGAKGVGKSAVTVRFLTKRYIGEYDSEKDQSYHMVCPVGTRNMPVEFIDTTCPDAQNPLYPTEHDLHSASGVVIVFSITDPLSFSHACNLLDHLNHTCTSYRPPVLLLANKADLQQQTAPTLDAEEASRVAVDASAMFAHVSAAEGYENIECALTDLLREIGARVKGSLARKRKLTFQTVSKALVAMISRGKSSNSVGDGDSEGVKEGEAARTRWKTRSESG